MTRRVPSRSRRPWARFALFLLFLFPLVPSRLAAADLFPGYPEAVREQAVRVVEAAGPGKGEALEREVRALRRAMFDHAILSMNAVPDRIFDRAAREGWKRRSYGSLHAVARVAPLSVPLWAWLAEEDAARFRLEEFLSDVDGLSGALRQYAPGLLGYAVWLLLFASASACWFAVWASLNLLLRARPALTSDVARLFKGLPRPEIFASGVVLAGFVAPVAFGAGIAAAAVFWIALSTPYLRRGELVTGGTAILLLAGVFLCGGFLEAIHPVAGMARGGWLGGEGYYFRGGSGSGSGDAGEGLLTGPHWERMARFARARAEMQGGDLRTAESLWTGLIEEGGDPADAYNNRGIVRVRLGRTEEGLADFEAAASLRPTDGRAQWNAYQLYLQEFRLDRAARIQPAAWAGIRGLAPFDYRAEEMTHGELVASPLRVGDVWKTLFTVREEGLRDARRSAFHDLFFRPVPGGWVLGFLAAGWVWAALWKLLSRKIWMSSVCRSCGAGTLVVGSREASDICNACGAQVGKGVRGGEERERRVLSISLHRRYVRACSVLLPGAGALWAGKELRAMLYGILLSLSAGLFTVSWSAGRLAGGLIGDMQTDIWRVALGAAGVLWLFGAAWGWRSFENLQLYHNVSGERL
ncbi:MAG: tetratricopeptide repeat protein [Desulfobacteria bacterium]